MDSIVVLPFPVPGDRWSQLIRVKFVVCLLPLTFCGLSCTFRGEVHCCFFFEGVRGAFERESRN